MARREGKIPEELLTGMERQAAIRGVDREELFEASVRSELAAYRNPGPGPLADLEALNLSFDWPKPGIPSGTSGPSPLSSGSAAWTSGRSHRSL